MVVGGAARVLTHRFLLSSLWLWGVLPDRRVMGPPPWGLALVALLRGDARGCPSAWCRSRVGGSRRGREHVPDHRGRADVGTRVARLVAAPARAGLPSGGGSSPALPRRGGGRCAGTRELSVSSAVSRAVGLHFDQLRLVVTRSDQGRPSTISRRAGAVGLFVGGQSRHGAVSPRRAATSVGVAACRCPLLIMGVGVPSERELLPAHQDPADLG